MSTRAAQVEAVRRMLRKSGERDVEASPALVEAVQLGATAPDVLAAVADAAGEEDPLAFGLAVLVARLRQACAPDVSAAVGDAAPAQARPVPWSADQLARNKERARAAAAHARAVLGRGGR